jgi:tetratricopeptide (TPR) repeat protein
VRLLAARPDERSFEDERWGGGHGVFTYSLLEGLRGKAERDPDGMIRIPEVAEYLASRVPNETRAQQHPRVTGSPEVSRPLALVRPGDIRPVAASIASPLVAQMESKIAAGEVLGPNGAWEMYRQMVAHSPDHPNRTRVEIALAEALEGIGQRAVNDYVQPTGLSLKRTLLSRGAEAYRNLMVLRPEPYIEAKRLFCEGRLKIIEERPAEAAALLRRSVAIDPRNACPHAALGVALEKLGDNDAALESFRNAAARAPEWSLPRVQLATQLKSRKQFDRAIDEVRAAISFYPIALQPRWMLTNLLRTTNRLQEAEKTAGDILRIDPNYAPAYVELGQIYEAQQRYEQAADAYAAYVQLAPNFSDTAAVRARAGQIRGIARRPVPTLLRDK